MELGTIVWALDDLRNYSPIECIYQGRWKHNLKAVPHKVLLVSTLSGDRLVEDARVVYDNEQQAIGAQKFALLNKHSLH